MPALGSTEGHFSGEQEVWRPGDLSLLSHVGCCDLGKGGQLMQSSVSIWKMKVG